ncbi:uncharacterized protein TNCV_609521 [Trichonephila clavipes]|nr:uncharacterized protein TNCV_609521 [Trichonephila clavipes]
MCKADGWRGMRDELTVRLTLSKPKEDSLEMYNRSSISSEFNFEMYRRMPELANLVMENSSEGIVKDSEILYSIFINSLREDTEYLLDLGVIGRGQSNCTLPVVWLGRVNRYPYPRIKCIKYWNWNQAEIYLLLKGESLVEKNNAASWVTVLDLWKWYFRRSLSKYSAWPGGIIIIMRFKSSYGWNLMTHILRWLEQIDASRMVDIDILMQIWKNRVKQIDFVLKWLSRVGSKGSPIKGFLYWSVSLIRQPFGVKCEELNQPKARAVQGKGPFQGEGVVTSLIVVNPHPSILDKFYGFIQQLNDPCTCPWDHCLLFEHEQERRHPDWPS